MIRLITAILAVTLISGVALGDIAGKPRVIDGDTIEIAGQHIRIHGIDAPEAQQTCQDQRGRWRCGSDSTNALVFLIAKSWVTCIQRDIDRYGRVVGICYAGGNGGSDIGERMVRKGWALAYRRFSTDYVDEEVEARANRRGLWRGSFIKPWDWRRGTRLDPLLLKPGLSHDAPQISEPTVGACCKICRKGKACGNTCVARNKTCHRPLGCACDSR